MPIHLTKQKVEMILAGISASCRSEMELALDTQVELSGECKQEIQGALSNIPSVNSHEGTSKRMKMMNQPPISDNTPPDMFQGEAPVALNTMFDVTVVLTSVIAVILTMLLLYRRGSSLGDSAKKSAGELSTRKLIVKAARRK